MPTTKKNTTPNSNPRTATAATPAPAAAAASPPAPTSPPTPASAPTPASPPTSPATPAITGSAADSGHAPLVALQMAYQTLCMGLLANYQPTDTFTLKAGTFTRDELVTLFQGALAAIEATKTAKQAWIGATQSQQATLAGARPVRSGLKLFFQMLYGKDGAQLRTYGFEPQKVGVTRVAVKAAAKVQSGETRKIRGTKGKRQRLEIVASLEPAAAPAPVSAAPTPTPSKQS